MKCRSNDTSKEIFWRAPVIEILPKKIARGGRISEEWSHIIYVNNSLSGQHDLIVDTTTMSAGTQYVCQEGPYDHVNGSLVGIAQLVVLGTYMYIIHIAVMLYRKCIYCPFKAYTLGALSALVYNNVKSHCERTIVDLQKVGY